MLRSLFTEYYVNHAKKKKKLNLSASISTQVNLYDYKIRMNAYFICS
uniref:Uncharacterized protein n=1 Tax=Anguilla anguilla TaxID=7936 RepID=A0A0E9V6W6_ANGAN